MPAAGAILEVERALGAVKIAILAGGAAAVCELAPARVMPE